MTRHTNLHGGSHQCMRGFGRMLLCLLILILTAGDLWSAPRRSSASRYLARQRQQQQQQKDRAIAAIRKEIAAAKQVLEQLSGQQGTTQAALQSAASQLASARKEADEAEREDSDLHRTLREIEERVLSNQPDDSEYARQWDAVEAARLQLDAQMHRTLGLDAHPEGSALEAERMKELSALSTEQRNRLNADPAYLQSRNALQAEKAKLDALEKKLLAQDDEFKKATAEHQTAEATEREKQAAQRSTAGDVAQARSKMLSQQQLLTQARQVISAGEQRLRQLGAKP